MADRSLTLCSDLRASTGSGKALAEADQAKLATLEEASLAQQAEVTKLRDRLAKAKKFIQEQDELFKKQHNEDHHSSLEEAEQSARSQIAHLTEELDRQKVSTSETRGQLADHELTAPRCCVADEHGRGGGALSAGAAADARGLARPLDEAHARGGRQRAGQRGEGRGGECELVEPAEGEDEGGWIGELHVVASGVGGECVCARGQEADDAVCGWRSGMAEPSELGRWRPTWGRANRFTNDIDTLFVYLYP